MSRSASCAADILAAWQENDSERLNKKLLKSVTPDFGPGENCYELERLELLDGLAAEIRGSIASGQDAGVYLGLLRHLAQPGGMPSN